jgi:hypothetical protein
MRVYVGGGMWDVVIHVLPPIFTFLMLVVDVGGYIHCFTLQSASSRLLQELRAFLSRDPTVGAAIFRGTVAVLIFFVLHV